MKNCFEMFAVGAVSTLLVLLFAASIDTPEAKRVYCENNMKKILSAVHAYQNDHGIIPPVMVIGKRYKFWNSYLDGEYIKDKQTLACPADPRNERFYTGRQNPLLPPNPRGAISYGMIYFITAKSAVQRGKAPLLSGLSNPAKVYLFADNKIAWMYPERLWKQDRTAWHEDDSINMLFADGHIEPLQERHMATKDKEGNWVYSMKYWTWN